MFDAGKAAGVTGVHRTKQDDGPKVNDPRLLPDEFLQRTAKVNPWRVTSTCVLSKVEGDQPWPPPTLYLLIFESHSPFQRE